MSPRICGFSVDFSEKPAIQNSLWLANGESELHSSNLNKFSLSLRPHSNEIEQNKAKAIHI